MPLGDDVSYKVKTTKSGKKIRLAFRNGEVIEAKNIETKATHTPSEFAKDKAKSKGKLGLK